MKKILSIIWLLILATGIANAQLPNIHKKDIYGVTHDLYNDLAAGNAVVVNFCAAWCEACRASDKGLQNLYEDACNGAGNIKVYEMLFQDYITQPTDSAFGQQYASFWHLTFPIVPDCKNEQQSFYSAYQSNLIPTTFIIIPNISNPANSTVHKIAGASETFALEIERILRTFGFPINNYKISTSGSFCSLPLTGVLTSNQAYGNIWSTGDTTQSINITAPGTYTLQHASVCGSVVKTAVVTPPVVAGIATTSNSVVCKNSSADFVLNYTGGSPTSTAMWQYYQYSLLFGPEWIDFFPADAGPVTLNAASYNFLGDTVYLRVVEKNLNTGINTCVVYSNTISVVYISANPSFDITTSDQCTFPVTLTSSYATGNIWSTGDTTQTITVNTPNTYTVNNSAACGVLVKNVTIEQPVAGTAFLLTDTIFSGNYPSPIKLRFSHTGVGINTWEWNIPQTDTIWHYADYAWGDLRDYNFPGFIGLIPGVQINFRVKTSTNNNCTVYSNTVQVQVVAQPQGVVGGLLISNTIQCPNSSYSLTYIGDTAGGAKWLTYSDYQGWKILSPVTNNVLQLTGNNPTTTVTGIPGNVYLVARQVGNSIVATNTVGISYLGTTLSSITGPTAICEGSVATLSISNQLTNIVWSPGGATTPSIPVNPVTSTIYTVTYTEQNGCTFTKTKSVWVAQNADPVIASSVSSTTCPGQAVTLSFTGTMNGTPCTTAFYGAWPTYPIDVSCNTNTPTWVADAWAGEYSIVNVIAGNTYSFLTVNSTNYYQGDQVTIADMGNTIVYATGQDAAYWVATFTGQVRFYTHKPNCAPTTNLNESIIRFVYCGNWSYAPQFYWQPSGQATQSITVSPTSTANYNLIVYGLEPNCNGSTPQQVEVANPLSPISGTLNICQGSSTTLSAANASSYAWSTGATTQSISVNAAGTYSVTRSYSAGCTFTSSATVSVAPMPVATITGNTSFCNGGSTVLSAAGATVTPLIQGFNPVNGVISLPGWLFQNNSVPGATSWFIGSANVFPSHSGSGYVGANYNNTSGANTISNWMITPTLTLQNNDEFSFWTRTVSNSTRADRLQVRMSTNGTSANVGVGSAAVGDFTTLLLDINPTLIYNGYPSTWTKYSITISGLPGPTTGRLAFRYYVPNGGPAGANSTYIGIDDAEYKTLSYNWSTGSTNQSITAATSGTYTLTVTSALGCTASATSIISQAPVLMANSNFSNVTINGLNNGTASSSASGGTPGYTYLWNIGATTSAITGLSPGNYCVTVTDAIGCTTSGCVTITQPYPLVMAAAVSNVKCRTAKNGSIALTPTGGVMPYSYLWTGGSTNASRNNLAPGTYCVTVTDVNGATTTNCYTITEPVANLLLNISKTNIPCGGKCTGKATAAPIGGWGGYTYLWNTGSTSANITGLCAGTYSVTVTDGGGCVKGTTFNITQNPILVTLATVTGATQATANASGGVAPYAYYWNSSPVQSTQTATGLTPGANYKVRVTDSKGCSVVASVQMPLPKIDSNSDESFKVFAYPNPTTGIVNLSFNSLENFSYTLSLYDLTGRMVYKQETSNGKGSNSNQFDFGTLSQGVYQLSVESEKGKATFKIILQ